MKIVQCGSTQYIPSIVGRMKHDDVIQWKHFPCYWPFVRGIHRSPVNSSDKRQWRGALMVSCPNKRLSNQSWGWWFETPSRPLWRHCNAQHSLQQINTINYLWKRLKKPLDEMTNAAQKLSLFSYHFFYYWIAKQKHFMCIYFGQYYVQGQFREKKAPQNMQS